MVKKSLAWVAGIIFVTSLIVTAGTLWLLKTPSGLQWGLSQLDSTLSVQEVSGNATALKLRGVRWSSPSAALFADDIQLNWRSLELLNRRILIDKLYVNKLRIINRLSAKAEAGAPWSGTRLPIDVFLRDGVVNQLMVYGDNEEELLSVKKIDLAAGVENNLLRIGRLNIVAADGQASISGKLDLAARRLGQVNLQNKLTWQVADNQISAQGSFKGTWAKLEVRQNIQDINGRKFDFLGSVTEPLSLQVLRHSQNQVKSELDLEAQWLLPFPPEQLGLTGDKLFNRGSVAVTGNPNAYQYQLESETVHDQVTLLTAELAGNGDLSGASISSLKAGEATSMAHGTGELQWAPLLKWQADLQFQDFNPGEFLPSLSSAPTLLNGRLRTSGERSAAANNVLGVIGEMKLVSLQGELNNQALSVEADIALTQSAIRLRSVKGSLGNATFTANGSLAEQIQASWGIDVPDLAVFDPRLAGVGKASGEISGSIETPRVNAKVQVDKVSYKDVEQSWQLDSASLDATASPADLAAPLSLDLILQNISQKGSSLAPEIKTKARGTLAQHKLTVEGDFIKKSRANLVLQGGFKEPTLNKWDGQFAELNMIDVNGVAWQLENPAQLELGANSQNLDEACVSAGDQQICLTAQQSIIQSQIEKVINFRLKDFSIVAFEPLLALYDIKPDGRLNGQLLIQQTATELTPRATARFFSDDFRLRVPLRAEEEDDSNKPRRRYQWLDFSELTLEAEQADQIDLAFSLARENGDGVRGSVNLAANLGLEDWQSAPLTAEIIARLNDLSILPPQLLADLQLNGALDANIQISGSVSTPRVAMNSELSQASLFIPSAGLDLQEINISAESSTDSKMTLLGTLRSGDGQMQIDGSVAYPDIANPSAELRLQGENIDFIQTGDIDAMGAIDLFAKFANQTVSVEGEVLVQKANLTLGAREDVVSASDDVIIEGQQTTQAKIMQRLRLTVDLGENTHIRAAGLDADLVGKLLILQEPGELITGRGKIEIKNGAYRAYGEKLDISRGLLIFNGTSIDDPNLELNATKTVNEIEAGVRVRGRAQAPELSLFSTPSMTDQDILSVLIFGKPVSNLASQDSLTLLKIAASLRGNGPDQFTRMTTRLQDMLGLTNLELRLTGDTPEVVAGKQLSSRFYVGYGYGLLDAVQSIVLRYKINEAWSIQGDFGADSGADLRYQLER